MYEKIRDVRIGSRLPDVISKESVVNIKPLKDAGKCIIYIIHAILKVSHLDH